MTDTPKTIWLTPVGDQWNNAWVNARDDYVAEEGDIRFHHDDTVTQLQADLTQAKAERDGLLRVVTDNHDALCRAEAAEAAIPCAYQMGLDAAAECASAERVAGDIRALTPPADIVEKALEKKHD